MTPLASDWRSWDLISSLAAVPICLSVSLTTLATASGPRWKAPKTGMPSAAITIISNWAHILGSISRQSPGPAQDVELRPGEEDALPPGPSREEMPPHKKEKQGGAAEKKELRLMLRVQSLERPSFHMWGVLQKKIKITGENTPGTVKPQTIWSFTVTGRGKSELTEKSPLQSITAACCSQNQGQEMKD